VAIRRPLAGAVPRPPDRAGAELEPPGPRAPQPAQAGPAVGLGALVALIAVAVALVGGQSSPPPPPPRPPTPQQLLDAYPGDAASPQAKARWMGRAARAAGIPAELPIMAALVESGLRNGKSVAYKGSYGYFGLRADVWDSGPYKGFRTHPPLQLKWFINQATAARDQSVRAGHDYAASPATYGVWVADIERPAERERGRYQLNLDVARTLLR
jgi:hypothetical protein